MSTHLLKAAASTTRPVVCPRGLPTGCSPTHRRRQWRSAPPHNALQAANRPRNGVSHSLAIRLPTMLRGAASTLFSSFGWAAGTRQLAPAAAWAALSGRPLTAQAAPAEPPVQHSTSEEALAEFREGVRTFAQDFVAPHAAEIDRLNAYPHGFEFWRTAGEWGLHGALHVNGRAEACLASRATAL